MASSLPAFYNARMAVPSYLEPYLTAAQRHGGGFGSLLWASPRTQMTRFEAIARIARLHDRSVIDAGCGRADLLDYLLSETIRPKQYIGLEAVDALADAADAKHHAMSRIVRGDFIKDISLFDQQAQTIVFSGSLNTLNNAEFDSTLRAAWNATGKELIFNFLSSPLLAASRHLTWHPPAVVLRLVGEFASDISMLDDYLDGDCTIAIRK